MEEIGPVAKRWRELSRWRQIAGQAAGESVASQAIVDVLANRADKGGFVTPDHELIDQTFRRDGANVIDLRSNDTIAPISLFLPDTELWLAAATGSDLRLVDEVVERLGILISFWQIEGDPLDGKAELRIPDVSEDRQQAYQLICHASREAAQWPLPVLGDKPSVSLPGSSWRRPASEYVRPRGQISVVSLNAAVTDARPDDFRPLDVRAAYMMRVMGLDYHRNAMRGRANPRFAWLELVPEPNNPHDDQAVAVDLDGVRIGYLAAQVAYKLHPVIRYQNLSGNACFVPAAVLAKDAVLAALPTYATMESLVDQALIESELQQLWTALSDEVRNAIRADGFSLTQGTLAAVASLRSLAPHVDLPPMKEPDAYRVHLSTFLAARRAEHRQELAAHRAEEKRAAHLRAERSKLGRQIRNEQIIDLANAGLSVSAIARQFDVSASVVRTVLKSAGVEASNAYTANSQRERIDRCADALRLQRQGLTRAEIAVAMGMAVDTVKLLLSDGRFYESPELHPPRLSLAIHAHRDGWTRRAVTSAAERKAINDAHALELTRPDLLLPHGSNDEVAEDREQDMTTPKSAAETSIRLLEQTRRLEARSRR